MFSTACAKGAKVELGPRTDLPSVRSPAAESPYRLPPLRIAITGLLTPRETMAGYADLLSYLEVELGRDVQLVQRGTYAEINALMQAGQVEMALVCPFPYVQGHRTFGMELLAAAVHRGEATHYSYLIVPADSRASTLEDLRGGTFAFSDPDSNSGWLAPTHQLALRGESARSFFGRHVFTYHHSESVRAVADHLVDAAAVDSLVYSNLTNTNPALIGKTRVLAEWGPYPSPPFVVRPDLDSALKERLRWLLVNMNGNPRGQEVLEKLGLDGFTITQDEAYDHIREMEALAGASLSVRR